MEEHAESAAREAWRCLAELWFNAENQDRFHRACEAADLSPPQLKALLWLQPGTTPAMGELAESLRCDASWVTGIVDGLEQRGYAERQVLPSDRRVKVVAITELGEKAQDRALARLHEPPAALDVLNDDEQRTLAALLRKVCQASGD